MEYCPLARATVFATYSLLHTAYCILHTVYCLLLTAYSPLPLVPRTNFYPPGGCLSVLPSVLALMSLVTVLFCLLSLVPDLVPWFFCCLLFTAYCILFTAYCLLLTALDVGNRRHFLTSLFPELAQITKNPVEAVAPGF